ncbi:MAG: YhbY family RNA-binding protein [Nanoarchaeota archaeon]|nr:YhbY family RNA-binding protein [Nanoarchaeota archaeon]MBU1028132.1 YhbY family RNA-binding protein [Nanoarchaeota archaeon]
MVTVAQFQLGKKGLTEGFIETLQNSFKHHRNIKISVLKSCCRERLYLKELADKMIERLGGNYSYKIIGYTVKLKKLRKVVR